MKINILFKVNEFCKGFWMLMICMESVLFVDGFSNMFSMRDFDDRWIFINDLRLEYRYCVRFYFY